MISQSGSTPRWCRTVETVPAKSSLSCWVSTLTATTASQTVAPLGDGLACLVQDPAAQGRHHPLCPGHGDELHRGDHASAGIAPPDEGLRGDQRSGTHVDLGLVLQIEVVVGEPHRGPQGPGQLPLCSAFGRHHGIEPHHGVGLFLLGGAHRDISTDQHSVQGVAVLGPDGDPDGTGELHITVADRDGFVDDGVDHRRQTGERAAVHRPRHDELVAAEPCDGRVGISSEDGQPMADLAQDQVPGRMTPSGVDLFEPVEVDEQHRQRSVWVARTPSVDPTSQTVAVRQAGQWVAFGQEAQAVRRLLQLVGEAADPPGIQPFPDDEAHEQGHDQPADERRPWSPGALLCEESRGGRASQDHVLVVSQRHGGRTRPRPRVVGVDVGVVGPNDLGVLLPVVDKGQRRRAIRVDARGTFHPLGYPQDRHRHSGPIRPPSFDRGRLRAGAIDRRVQQQCGGAVLHDVRQAGDLRLAGVACGQHGGTVARAVERIQAVGLAVPGLWVGVLNRQVLLALRGPDQAIGRGIADSVRMPVLGQ